jgi:hypothetical protein
LGAGQAARGRLQGARAGVVWPLGWSAGAGEGTVRAASLTSARGLKLGEPGHMMMDWVSHACGGCGRSVFGGRPRVALHGRAQAV